MVCGDCGTILDQDSQWSHTRHGDYLKRSSPALAGTDLKVSPCWRLVQTGLGSVPMSLLCWSPHTSHTLGTSVNPSLTSGDWSQTEWDPLGLGRDETRPITCASLVHTGVN